MEELHLYRNSQEQIHVCMCAFSVHECYMWAYGCLYVHCCVWSLCLAVNCAVHIVCVLVCVCACCVWMGYAYRWYMCGLVSLYQIRTQSHPILNSLLKMQWPYWILVSDIIFSLFSFYFIFFAFLWISTEMWQRIKLFTQTALNQSVPLAGSLFYYWF